MDVIANVDVVRIKILPKHEKDTTHNIDQLIHSDDNRAVDDSLKFLTENNLKYLSTHLAYV